MKFSFLIFVSLVATANSEGQELTIQNQLPMWAQERYESLAKQKSVKISQRINPFVLRGDFDGDGKFDLAVLVQNSQSKKEGIVFLLRRGASPIIGAGEDFGNGGDDFSWMDIWQVEDRGTLQRSYSEKPVRLKADGIVVIKEGSASALIYFYKGAPKWKQRGD